MDTRTADEIQVPQQKTSWMEFVKAHFREMLYQLRRTRKRNALLGRRYAHTFKLQRDDFLNMLLPERME